MKKILLAGAVACGKTTLCQRLNGLAQSYKKTQSLEVVGTTIDTPGEYLEHRSFLRGLVVTASEADLVLFLQDASQDRFLYFPGMAGMFPVPVAGVVTKADLATERQLRDAKEMLELTGASPIFIISSVTQEGMEALTAFLEE